MRLPLCDGLGLRECYGCARNSELADEAAIKRAPPTRIKPSTHNGRCLDWRAIPDPVPDTVEDRL